MNALVWVLLALLLAAPVVALVLSIVAFRRASYAAARAAALEARLGARVDRPADRPAPEPPRDAHPPSEPELERDSERPPVDPGNRRRDLERHFGTQVVVWLGAAALALAGAFLVKYSFDQGLLGPTARVALGLVFGVILLVVGEWTAKRQANLAEGLQSAGIAVLYAALLAGARLYDLYAPAVAFGGMVLTTATAVVLSLRRGQLVAVLGLLGGFLTPALVGSTEPRPWLLLAYLVLLQIGLLVVSRRKRWSRVAALTIVGALAWAVAWMAGVRVGGGDTVHVALLLVSSMVTLVLAVGASPERGPWKDARVPLGLVWAGGGVGTVLLAALVEVGGFGALEWTFLGIVSAGAIVLGRLEPRHEPLAWIAVVSGAVLLEAWGEQGAASSTPDAAWTVAASFAALFVVGGYAALWRSVRPWRWAALAATASVLYLLSAFGSFDGARHLAPWGVQALVVAALFVALVIPVARRRDALPDADRTLAALAVGATFHVSLAVPMELERVWITVAWALEVPAIAWIASRLRVRPLAALAWLIASATFVRSVLNPAVLDYPIGDRLVLNPLLYGYGVPVVAFVAAARRFRADAHRRLASALEIAAVVFGFVYLALSVRQYFHPDDLAASDVAFAEWGAFAVAWLLYALALLALHRRTGRRTHRVAATAIGCVALVLVVVVPGLLRNPSWTWIEVGDTLVWNRVLFVYGAPAALGALFGRALARLPDAGVSKLSRSLARAAGALALLLAFAAVSLVVRQAFRGSVLVEGTLQDAEMYAYSLAWIVFALVLLFAGIVTRGAVSRIGSAVVMLVAVGKVFLFDTAQLEGLYRVFSLLGLGITLMLLAWIYQRFVFTERPS